MFAEQVEQVVLPGRVDDVTLLVLLWVKKHDNASETHRSKNIKNLNRVETNYNYFISVKKRDKGRGNINFFDTDINIFNINIKYQYQLLLF